MMINRPHLTVADAIGVAAVVVQIALIVILLNLTREVKLQDPVTKKIFLSCFVSIIGIICWRSVGEVPSAQWQLFSLLSSRNQAPRSKAGSIQDLLHHPRPKAPAQNKFVKTSRNCRIIWLTQDREHSVAAHIWFILGEFRRSRS